ncbi:FeoB-associated Cys-rich membrane protein [uncultured Veillonella sp.]|uniref:FeoB-associated Cys-rich membrane protein n=1 Tax=uncultured Veillonella sp. TaxID=159268 RepID=UPI0028D3D40B|nr:FeoB-associated Cys-rich membrane protein [uncultured Veillonella sp.]
MDTLIIGLIVILALAYLGTKIYKQVSGKGGCGCGGGGSASNSKKSSGCGGNCSCDGSNKALGIKRTDH